MERFDLRDGEMYRVAYVAGGAQSPRVSRSLVIFEGLHERRRWDGEPTACLDFALPQGRTLSLLSSQLVDVRAAEINQRGQWVPLAKDPGERRGQTIRRTGAL